MRRYRVEVTGRIKKQLRQMPVRLARDIAEMIVSLADDPYPDYADELDRDLTRRYRIRVDGWRLIYMVNEGDSVVKVLALRPRDENTYLNLP